MRLYCQDDTYYLSATTLINEYKPFNEKLYFEAMWRKGLDPQWVDRQSRRLGNMVHNWIENAASGVSDFFDEAPESLNQRKLRQAVDKFLRDYEVLDSEKVVINRQYRYAGRLDGKIRRKADGKLFLGDFKTWNAWKGDNSPLTFAEVKNIYRDKIYKVATQTTLYDEVEHVGDLMCILFQTNGEYYEIPLKRDEKILKWIESNSAWIEAAIERALLLDSTDIKYIDYD